MSILLCLSIAPGGCSSSGNKSTDAAGSGGTGGRPDAAGDGAASHDCSTPIGTYDSCEGACGCSPKNQVPTPVVTATTVTNECGTSDTATITGNVVMAYGETATLSADGTKLMWADGSNWVRSCGP